MEPLNRVALIVRPKRRYKEWADSVADSDEDPVFDLDAARTSPAVYLVAARDDLSLQDLIDEYAAELFEFELEAWHTDEAGWPVNRSPHVFRDWFDVSLGETVIDLDPEEALDIEMGDAPESDLLAALSGDPDATLRCAWCEAVIEPDHPVASVTLAAPRSSHPQPELIEVEVADRVFQAVVPSDASEAGRRGVAAFLTFCGDDCAQAFRALWKRERGALSS